jgi:uncharacterized protein (TIGR02145 family)
MKSRILLTISIPGIIISAIAQKPTMILTFTADDNGQHVPIDSILVENLTQGVDTTLYAPDTVLVLDYEAGITENNTIETNVFTLFQNYPNPIMGQTSVVLYLSEGENVLITISDLFGREVFNSKYILDYGTHFFTFLPGKEDLYFFTASVGQQIQTIKMFNIPSTSHGYGICKLEYNGQQIDKVLNKSINNLNNFVFNLGDLLKLTSFTNQGERVITITPTVSQTCYFHYTGNPCSGTPTITDIDGNIYNTVQIGDQCWMKENLKTTTYSNGTPIPNIIDNQEWTTISTGAYAWQENDISWKNVYGAIYNWYTTVDPNGLCPAGWHVPSDDEWTVLTDFIGGTESPHGNELKSCRQVNSPLGGGCTTTEHPRWEEYDNNYYYGTDDYGFSGLPGGNRDCVSPGSFGNIGIIGLWWSTSQYGPDHLAGFRGLIYHYSSVSYQGHVNQHFGYSVRCLRD